MSFVRKRYDLGFEPEFSGNDILEHLRKALPEEVGNPHQLSEVTDLETFKKAMLFVDWFKYTIISENMEFFRQHQKELDKISDRVESAFLEKKYGKEKADEFMKEAEKERCGGADE